MISPICAPPGTVIYCTNATPSRSGTGHNLVAGAEYVVRDWCTAGGVMGVRVHGAIGYTRRNADYCFDGSRFRLPVTPEGLLSVPSEAPADLDRRTAPVSPRKRVRA